MRRKHTTFIVLAVVALGAAFTLLSLRHPPRRGAETSDALAEAFINAVNAHDLKQHEKLIHPRCFEDLSTAEKQFLHESMARELQRTIPHQRSIEVSKLDGTALPFADMVDWRVKPTHRMDIDFQTGEYAHTSIIRFVVQEKGRWFIVLPILNDENLRKYEERKKSQPIMPSDAEDAAAEE